MDVCHYRRHFDEFGQSGHSAMKSGVINTRLRFILSAFFHQKVSQIHEYPVEVVGTKGGIAFGAFSSPVVVALSDALKAEDMSAFVQDGVFLARLAGGTGHGLLQFLGNKINKEILYLPEECGSPPAALDQCFPSSPSSWLCPTSSSANSSPPRVS